MNQTVEKYCYDYNAVNQNTTCFLIVRIANKLPKINLKLPVISVEACENLNLTLV